MLLTQSDLSLAESELFFDLEMLSELETELMLESPTEPVDGETDVESLEIYRCWKEQGTHRFGAGSPAPSIPRSQRQFDGDNWFDYCEPYLY